MRFTALVALVLPLSAALPGAVAEPPKLAIVLSIDQFRGDYLTRFGPYFGEGGFKRLLAGGTHFDNCRQRHSITQTAPGHASILSGAFTSEHGISSNEWLDRATWDMINSVEDRDAPLVGITPAELGPVAVANPAKTGRSPRNLQAETVGDQLKAKYGAKSKIFAASNKDRSAILLGGKKADVAYWDENGKIVTSRYYRESLPAWVEAFNAEKRVHATFGRTWDRLRDVAIYNQVQGLDDDPAESDSVGLGRTLPKKITGGKNTITPAFFTAFDNSPFAAEFLGEFVQRAIREEKLGRNGATDLLCVSFSSIDAAGHTFGPDSHEVMDAVLRIDRVVAALLDCIDREIGLARCVLVFTADHGVSPLPERTLARDPAAVAGRVKVGDLDAAAKQALDARYGALGKGENWFTRDNAGYHVRPEALAAKNVSAGEVASTLKAALLPLPYIAEVYTREELLATPMTGESTRVLMRRSYRGASDRDVVYALKPHFMTKTGGGSSHGLPYDYDMHVPQLWFGQGVPAGVVRKEAVGVDAIAATLSALLGLPPPPQAQSPKVL
ncbi:alkaline phosphatase family protein [Horticoccus sp. 23ND18S-11]|uniref:alkaline phosphatase family protein n=1 Tax=Horticoccus sp. 23ND18S-11 TaxID=3391832 RepID=UPI0039C9CDAD